jgi:FkbM family methyltransferase
VTSRKRFLLENSSLPVEFARFIWRKVRGPEAALTEIPLAVVRLFRGRYTIVQTDVGPMHVDLRDIGVAFWLLVSGQFEPTETALVRRVIPVGATVLDVGAHIGYFTRTFAQIVGPEGTVIAIEPDAANFRMLERNVTLLANGPTVELENGGAGDARKSATVYASRFGNTGDTRLTPSPTHRATGTIEVVPLDELIGERSIRFIKIDVQGYEAAAFRGLKGTLSRRGPIGILFEFWPAGLSANDEDPFAMLQDLVDLGFTLERIEGDKLEPIDVAGLKAEAWDSARFSNLLATKTE